MRFHSSSTDATLETFHILRMATIKHQVLTVLVVSLEKRYGDTTHGRILNLVARCSTRLAFANGHVVPVFGVAKFWHQRHASGH
jgi:hypothetical protein